MGANAASAKVASDRNRSCCAGWRIELRARRNVAVHDTCFARHPRGSRTGYTRSVSGSSHIENVARAWKSLTRIQDSYQESENTHSGHKWAYSPPFSDSDRAWKNSGTGERAVPSELLFRANPIFSFWWARARHGPSMWMRAFLALCHVVTVISYEVCHSPDGVRKILGTCHAGKIPRVGWRSIRKYNSHTRHESTPLRRSPGVAQQAHRRSFHSIRILLM